MRRIRKEDAYYADTWNHITSLIVEDGDYTGYLILPETKVINGVECDMHITDIKKGILYIETVAHSDYCMHIANPTDRLVSLGVVYDTKEKAIKSCKARYGIKDDE